MTLEQRALVDVNVPIGDAHSEMAEGHPSGVVQTGVAMRGGRVSADLSFAQRTGGLPWLTVAERCRAQKAAVPPRSAGPRRKCGHSMAGRAIAGGSRPATSQPVAAAARHGPLRDGSRSLDQ
jgi:hypothetical protein